MPLRQGDVNPAGARDGDGHSNDTFILEKRRACQAGSQKDTAPLFGRLSCRVTPQIRADLHAGAAFRSPVRVFDPRGHKPYLTGYDLSPLLAVSLTAEF